MMLRPAPDGYADTLAASPRVTTRVDAWRGGELLASGVPILDGTLTENGDQAVPETLTLSVPARGHDGREWTPRGPLDPLAHYGQTLRATYLVERGDGTRLAVPLGWFLIDEWDANGWTVDLQAVGMLARVETDRLLAPTSPPAGATLGSELARLVEGILPLDIDPTLTDRPAPRSFAWQDDRLGALYEIADAWPARLSVDETGTLRANRPPSPADPADLVLVEGAENGTVISSADAGTREGVYNVVVARGEDAANPDRPPVWAAVEDTDQASPTYARGPYGRVVRFFASPLVTTVEQARASATTMLGNSLRRARTFPVDTVPDARIRPGVRVDFLRATGETVPTRVTSSTLPLTAAGGAMRLELSEVL